VAIARNAEDEAETEAVPAADSTAELKGDST
jgi:hypothetical protein